MTPSDIALAIVRAGLRDVRVWIGETTEDAENYVARHAKQEVA